MIPCPHFSNFIGFWVYWDSVKILSYRRYFSVEVCRVECLSSASSSISLQIFGITLTDNCGRGFAYSFFLHIQKNDFVPADDIATISAEAGRRRQHHPSQLIFTV